MPINNTELTVERVLQQQCHRMLIQRYFIFRLLYCCPLLLLRTQQGLAFFLGSEAVIQPRPMWTSSDATAVVHSLTFLAILDKQMGART